MALYNSRWSLDPQFLGVKVTKFDDDLNVVASYLVTEKVCTCPAAFDRTCKHRKKFHTLFGIANTGKFWDDETDRILTLEGLRCA